MNWQRLIDLGVMTPQSLEQARGNALAQGLMEAGAAFQAAGAPSHTPGGRPLNLAPVFTNYQNALANSMKQGLMMKQLERQEEEYKRAKANRQKLANMFTSDKRMMPTGRQKPTGEFETKEQFISDLSLNIRRELGLIHITGAIFPLPVQGQLIGSYPVIKILIRGK